MNIGLIILGVGVVAVLAMTMSKPKLTTRQRQELLGEIPGS